MGLSAREAAKSLGLTHPALLKAAKSGRITRGNDGTYDVEKVRRQLAENSNALKRRTSKKGRAEVVTGVVTEGGNHPEVVTSSVTVPIGELDDPRDR
ncbi:MAG: hypothetical protein ACR2JB_19105 [Bryobacteraceae bacterium]